MSSQPESKVDLPLVSASPLARCLGFVAIVWSIAGTFLALEFAWPELLRWSIGAGWISEELAMPTPERMPAALVCRQEEIDAGEAATVDLDDPVAMRRVGYASWMLGQQFGFAAVMANLGRPDAQTAPLREELQSWAAMLQLPTPAAPKSEHILHQLNDFSDHLEADPQCVAARLTRRYGPRYGYLYKFGAVVGYAIPAMVQNVGGSFALQIQLYGGKAGIPQELWRPMTLDSLAHLPGADPREKVIGVVERIGEHIATSP